jgi:hypothetical protein
MSATKRRDNQQENRQARIDRAAMQRFGIWWEGRKPGPMKQRARPDAKDNKRVA